MMVNAYATTWWMSNMVDDGKCVFCSMCFWKAERVDMNALRKNVREAIWSVAAAAGRPASHPSAHRQTVMSDGLRGRMAHRRRTTLHPAPWRFFRLCLGFDLERRGSYFIPYHAARSPRHRENWAGAEPSYVCMCGRHSDFLSLSFGLSVSHQLLPPYLYIFISVWPFVLFKKYFFLKKIVTHKFLFMFYFYVLLSNNNKNTNNNFFQIKRTIKCWI